MRATSRCKACHAPIRWARNAKTDKSMPLDPDADPDGNIWIVGFENGTPVFEVAGTPAEVPANEPLRYLSHFVTCPAAAEFRKAPPPTLLD